MRSSFFEPPATIVTAPTRWFAWDRPSSSAAQVVDLLRSLDHRAVESAVVQPPASELEIEELAGRLGRPLPPELRELYRHFGGLRIRAAGGAAIELTQLAEADSIPGVVEVAQSSWCDSPWQLDWRYEVIRRSEVERCNQSLLCLGWCCKSDAARTFLCVDRCGLLVAVTCERDDVLQFRADLLRLIEGSHSGVDPLEPLLALLGDWMHADG